jgi:hypothetical protein
MTVASPVATYVTLGGVSIENMSAELDKWATNLLDEAVRTVPAERRFRWLTVPDKAGE